VERFRPYVELMPFTIVTDHASLQWLMTLKDLNRRLARWSLALQAFDFNIEHRKGKDNIEADMLSRPNETAEVEFFDFETTEFESPEYLERLQLIEELCCPVLMSRKIRREDCRCPSVNFRFVFVVSAA